MASFVVSGPAAADLGDIHAWIAYDDPVAAGRVLEELRPAMQRLVDQPGLGHVRDDLADETLKIWPVRSYLVIYRPATTPLQIVRVLSGYRDIAALFE